MTEEYDPMFEGVGSAKANFGANYERPGHYLMFIRRVKKDKTRKGIKFVAVEKVCLHYFSVDEEENPHTVGEQCSHLLMTDKDSFLGNLKAMISNCFGKPPEAVTPKVCDLVVSDKQPMSCRVVEMDNRLIITKEKKLPFTQINYRRTLAADEILAVVPRNVLEQFLSVKELEFLLKEKTETATE